MSDKKDKILQAALALFANEGFTATSTNKVAKKAGVSEGLIFRHFHNKEGLLQALIDQGEQKMKLLMADILMETDQRQVIVRTLEMPFKVPKEEYDFWRLQFKLKWELNDQQHDKMLPVKQALSRAFASLGYLQPDLEAQLVLFVIDATSSALLKGQVQNAEELKAFLRSKYYI